MKTDDPRMPKRPSRLSAALVAAQRDLRDAEHRRAELDAQIPRMRELIIRLEQEIAEELDG